MRPSEIKDLIIGSLDKNANVAEIAESFDKEGVSFDFSEDFENKVFEELFGASIGVEYGTSVFYKSFSSICCQVSMIGVVAIILLIVSIFLTQGEVTLNSFFGLGNIYDESMFYLMSSAY